MDNYFFFDPSFFVIGSLFDINEIFPLWSL